MKPNPMLRLLPLPLLLALSLLVGCTTVNWQDDLATATNLAAYVGASVDIEDNPERRVFYVASKAALDSLIRDENWSPAAFTAAMRQLPIKELTGRKGTLVVGAAVVLWTRATARVDIDQVALVKLVLPAVRDGLAQALSESDGTITLLR